MRIGTWILVAMLAGWYVPAPAVAASPAPAMQQTADPAADMVHNFGMGSNLERMANTTAAMTHTYGMVSAAKVTAEIHRLAPKYQAQWDANLVKAYAAHLAPNELRSLARQGSASPYFAKLRQQQAAVGVDMRASSSSILQALVTEALSNAMKQQ